MGWLELTSVKRIKCPKYSNVMTVAMDDENAYCMRLAGEERTVRVKRSKKTESVEEEKWDLEAEYLEALDH